MQINKYHIVCSLPRVLNHQNPELRSVRDQRGKPKQVLERRDVSIAGQLCADKDTQFCILCTDAHATSTAALSVCCWLAE